MSKNKKKPWAENGLEDWGSYMDAKKNKLEEQFEDAAKKEFENATSLFSGIAIFVNGYTSPCADELKRLMMAHGGIYHHYLRSRITTHIIASNLPYSKIVAYRKSQNPLPICKPEWITDSLKAQKVLDWRPYVLYSNSTVTQPQLQFAGKSNDSLLSATASKTKQIESNSVAQDSSEIVGPSTIPSLKTPAKHNESPKNPGVSSDPIPVQSKPNSGLLCSKNSEFLSEFYNNSRLHHISTMGATFKDYVNELRAKSGGTFSGLDRLKLLPKNAVPCSSVKNDSDSEDDLFESAPLASEKVGKDPVIMHIDMDCFFVSVGLRNRPELKGLPVAVTHAKGNKQNSKTGSNSKNDDSDEDEDYGSLSEIASCSYEARKAGLKNGMFLGQALKLCPNLKTIKYDFEGYKEVSYILYNTVASYTLNIEAVSCDEMYADVTSVLKQSQLTPTQFASVIRAEIKEKTGCPVSTGFGCNKLQARLATRKAKPDGQFYLESSKVQEYIGSMVVRDLPGVGSSTMQLLHQMNVRTCSDLQNVALGVLQREFGKKTGEQLHNMCRGVDNSKLNFEHVRKSVSAEVNYGIRFENGNDAEEFLRKLSLEVSSRLQKANAKGRSVTLKLMIRARDAPKEAMKFMGHGVCDNFTKSKNLIAPIDDPAIITKEVLSLWNQMQQLPEDVRGIGIQIARLEFLKLRSGSSNMMNFINKAKQSDSEVPPKVSRSSANEPLKSTINSDLPESNNIEKGSSKNLQIAEAKPRGLKAFLVPKDQRSSKSNSHANPREAGATDIGEIDESVLAELPADIRMEILKSRGECRISGSIDPQPSTSRAPDFVGDEPLAAPLRLNDEDKETSSLPADEAPPMENIDESVFNELPEDIRNEILKNTGKILIKSREPERPTKTRKTQQETFFKNKKSVSDEPLAAPLRLNDEDKETRSSLPADEARPMENIDEAVLNELPEDIRNEILKNTGKILIKSREPERPTKTRQTQQETFFKHKKSASGKSGKANMPAIEEIDMSVLIELPEDIRNEIINEYKAKKQAESSNIDNNEKIESKETLPPEKTSNSRVSDKNDVAEDGNVSFSQVDPEFLAALSEDMKTDVEMYCIAKKKEKLSKTNKASDANPTVANILTKNRNSLKQNKKIVASTKSKGNKKVNSVKGNSNERRYVKKSPEIAKRIETKVEERRKQTNEDHNSSGRFLESEFTVDPEAGATLKQRQEIISHHSSFTGNRARTDEQEMLTNLVNYLFTLPLQQVKMQIQTWISKSVDVNEIDLLSLATFLSMLPKKKRLEELHILLKTMHRCITRTGSCVWHGAYRRTVDHVQRYMQIEYNSNLMLPRIECDCRKCEK